MTPAITPFLWFDGRAQEAATFYTSIFKNSKIENQDSDDDNPMSVTFELDGQRFIAFNGGPQFKFTEAISFMAHCDTQAEVDHLWDKLSEGGEQIQCGWLKDKFGVTWQIVPNVLKALLDNPNPEISQRVMNAMLQMKKLDINALKQAAKHVKYID